MKDRVIFRTYKHGQFKGDVLAVFPDYDEGSGLVRCYAHVGQHGSCHYRAAVVPETRPSTPEEAAPLAAELTRLGYDLFRIRRFVERKV